MSCIKHTMSAEKYFSPDMYEGGLHKTENEPMNIDDIVESVIRELGERKNLPSKEYLRMRISEKAKASGFETDEDTLLNIEKEVVFRFHKEKFQEMADIIALDVRNERKFALNTNYFNLQRRTDISRFLQRYIKDKDDKLDWDFIVKHLDALLAESEDKRVQDTHLEDYLELQPKSSWTKDRCIDELAEYMQTFEVKHKDTKKTFFSHLIEENSKLRDALKTYFPENDKKKSIHWPAVKELFMERYPNLSELYERIDPKMRVERFTEIKRLASINRETALTTVAQDILRVLEELQPEKWGSSIINEPGLKYIAKIIYGQALDSKKERITWNMLVSRLPQKWRDRYNPTIPMSQWVESKKWREGPEEQKAVDDILKKVEDIQIDGRQFEDLRSKDVLMQFGYDAVRRYHDTYHQLVMEAKSGNRVAMNTLNDLLSKNYDVKLFHGKDIPQKSIDEMKISAVKNYKGEQFMKRDKRVVTFIEYYRSRASYLKFEKRWETTKKITSLDDKMKDFESYAADTTELELSWIDTYKRSAHAFFAGGNLKELKEVSAGERVNLLALAAQDLSATPEEIASYFTEFPEDAGLVSRIYIEYGGKPHTRYEALFGASYPYFREKLPKRFRVSDPHYQILSEKRNMASGMVLRGYEKNALNALPQSLKDRALQMLEKDSSFLFVKEDQNYETFLDDEKFNFCKALLGESQYRLLHDEVYRRHTSEENALAFERMKDFGNEKNASYHSMLYGYGKKYGMYDRTDSEKMWDTGKFSVQRDLATFQAMIETLETIEELKVPQQQKVDAILDFWLKNQNPVFLQTVMNILNQDGQYAFQRLQELGKISFTDQKAMFVLMHRLELGEGKMTPQGVEYLGVTYDLGEYGSEARSVKRISADGKLGIFDSDAELIGYFEVKHEDIPSTGKVVKPLIKKLHVEDIFALPKKDDRTQQKFVGVFQRRYKKISERDIWKKSEVKFENLNFLEKSQFIGRIVAMEEEVKDAIMNKDRHAEDAAREKMEAFEKFTGRFGERGVRVFFALEADAGLEQKILALSSAIDEKICDKIFLQFEMLGRYAAMSATELGKRFYKGEKDLPAHAEILKRAAKMLGNFFEVAVTSDFSKKTYTEKQRLYDKIETDLRKIDQEARIFGAMFKAAAESGSTMEEVKGLDFELVNGNALESKDLSEMERIIEENYSDERREKVIKSIREVFDDREKSRKNQWHILRRDGKMLAFGRIEDIGDGNFGAWSLNVDKAYQDSNIGRVFSKKFIDAGAEKGKLLGKVQIENKVMPFFIEEAAYVGYEIKEEVGGKYLMLLRDDEVNMRYVSKGKKYDAADLAKKISGSGEANEIEKGVFGMAFDPRNTESFEKMLANGFVVTRIIKHEHAPMLIFEKKL